MPVSVSQHRASVGTYQNKHHDNFRVNATTQALSINQNRSAIPDEIRHLGRRINRVVNSHVEQSRPSYPPTNPRQGMATSLLMLILLAGVGRKTVSENEIKHPNSGDFQQSGDSNNLLSTLRESIPQTLSRAGEFMLQYDPLRFPGASALPVGGYQDNDKAIDIVRLPRYAIFKKKTTTSLPVPDDVKIEKLDFSCFEERQNLSIADVFRQIGNTLSNPVSELANEYQVINYYHNYHRCPTPEEIRNLQSITEAVDKTISVITALLPNAQPLVVAQRLGGPLFRMMADNADNQQMDIENIREANDQIIALVKIIVDSSPKNYKGKTIESQLTVPEGLILKKNKIAIKINGKDRDLTYDNGKYFTHINGKRRRVSYSPENKEWINTHRHFKKYGDDVYFPRHIGKESNGGIDKKTLSAISPNQHGIYTVTSKLSAESFHAIKIGDKFYRYIPANEKDVSLSGVIKTDNADIKVSRFDKRYFIVNEKKKLLVNYSPCRLRRSPDSSCLHFSKGLIKKLVTSRSNGISARKIQGLRPSESKPGLYESSKGKLFLEYKGSYFKLTGIEGGLADSQFMVTGKKRFGSKEITPICFSRERGLNYINTPLENMMESAGMSKVEAMSHIETSPKMQPVVIGTGSISEVYDLGNGFVSKTYKGKIDKSHKSRLVAANKNAKGFNRYYGDGSATVSIIQHADGTASASAKLKKIEGHVLSEIQHQSNKILLKEIGSAISISNPSEKLSNILQSRGIVHYDINKGNIIYNKGKFFIIDFDSANFLPKGEIVSESQTKSMKEKFKHVFDDVLRDIESKVISKEGG